MHKSIAHLIRLDKCEERVLNLIFNQRFLNLSILLNMHLTRKKYLILINFSYR